VEEELSTSICNAFIEILFLWNECVTLELKFEILLARLDRQWSNHINMRVGVEKKSHFRPFFLGFLIISGKQARGQIKTTFLSSETAFHASRTVFLASRT